MGVGVMILRSCFLVLVAVETLLIMEDDVIDDVGLTGWKIRIVESSSSVVVVSILISYEVEAAEGIVETRHVNIIAACNSSISSSSSCCFQFKFLLWVHGGGVML